MASNPFGSPPQGFGWGGSPGGEFGRGEQPSPGVLDFGLDSQQAGPSSAAEECLNPQVSNLNNNAWNSAQARDVSMSGIDLADQGNGGPQAHGSDNNASGEKATQPRAQGRSKYRNLDWDASKPMVKNLYIDQHMSLAETMKVMEKDFSFRASKKAYKDQFDIWNWKKNLPKDIAHFIVENSRRRKRKKKKKDTVYTYGGKKWTAARAERTISRAKAGYNPLEYADGNTPDGVTYKTPSTIASPTQGSGARDNSSDEPGSDSSSIASPIGSETDSGFTEIPLSFKGMSRTDLLAMWEVARTRSNEITSEEKEKMLNDVLDGLIHLQGATNEETNKVAYALAGFYVDIQRSPEADKLLERQTQAHIDSLGHDHRKTLQHILHVVELLNAWNRPEDALGMLSKVREMSASQPNTTAISTRTTRSRDALRRGKGKEKASGRENSLASGGANFARIADLVSNNPTPAQINLALSTARPVVRASDANAEEVLLAVIRQCTPRPLELAPQLLRATADLLSLYQKLGIQDAHYADFQRAQTAVSSILGSHVLWNLDSFYGFEVVEASLEVVARLIRCGYMKEGTVLFRKIQDVGLSVFGPSDERLIWTLISIGLVYQTHGTWEDARDWFEGAFAATLSTTWGRSDGIVQALQRALDRHHFS